jgi:hypothetical protein
LSDKLVSNLNNITTLKKLLGNPYFLSNSINKNVWLSNKMDNELFFKKVLLNEFLNKESNLNKNFFTSSLNNINNFESSIAYLTNRYKFFQLYTNSQQFLLYDKNILKSKLAGSDFYINNFNIYINGDLGSICNNFSFYKKNLFSELYVNLNYNTNKANFDNMFTNKGLLVSYNLNFIKFINFAIKFIPSLTPP